MALPKGFLVRLSYHIEPPPHMLVPINQNAKRKTQNAKRKEINTVREVKKDSYPCQML
jgi:hypothetical protein